MSVSKEDLVVLGCTSNDQEIPDDANAISFIPPCQPSPPASQHTLSSPSAAPAPALDAPANYKTKRKLAHRARKKASRARKGYSRTQKSTKRLARKHHKEAKQVATKITLEELQGSNAAFARLCTPVDDPITVERELVEKGTFLVDLKHRIFALRATPSGDRVPPNLCENLETSIHKLGAQFRTGEPIDNSRKNHASVSFGISYGAGQVKPSCLIGENKESAEEFMADSNVQVYAYHITNIFETWWPKLFHRYQENITLLEDYESLQRPLKRCPFTTLTVDSGPQAVSRRRRGFRNLSSGLCAIVFLGSYDYKTGGRLLLEEANVELEVAPGDIVFFPSACTHYSISPIAQGETIYSMTFYTPSQLFHWVDSQHRLSPTGALRTAVSEEDATGDLQCTKTGWDLYMTTKELQDYVDEPEDHSATKPEQTSTPS